MPCRALEAFGHSRPLVGRGQKEKGGLNALSGIGGVRTPNLKEAQDESGYRSLNALSGIGGVRTSSSNQSRPIISFRLNALSGIGGVRTPSGGSYLLRARDGVLMPCRALEAFGRRQDPQTRPKLAIIQVLMPCRALEAFGRCTAPSASRRRWRMRLNALSGIGGVRTAGYCASGPLRPTWVLMPCRALEAFGRNAGLRSVV